MAATTLLRTNLATLVAVSKAHRARAAFERVQDERALVAIQDFYGERGAEARRLLEAFEAMQVQPRA